jgi:hypothetical protein
VKNFACQLNPLLLFLAASLVLAFTEAPAVAADQAAKTRVLLLGASVGQDWRVDGLPKRLGNDRFQFEAVQAWQFDKTEALDEVLMRPKRKFKPTKTYLKGFFEPAPAKPDVIIIKECAAYFPGDLTSYREMVKKWVSTIRAAGRKPVIATVVPITRARTLTNPGRIESIRAFNDWVREYAAGEKMPLIDLEAALRTDGKERLLKDEYSTDGLHLNRKAYDALDKLLLDASVKATTAERR